MIRYSDYPMGVFEGYGDEIPESEQPIAQRVECTSCDDKGCGFCVTGDSLAAYFPNE